MAPRSSHVAFVGVAGALGHSQVSLRGRAQARVVSRMCACLRTTRALARGRAGWRTGGWASRRGGGMGGRGVWAGGQAGVPRVGGWAGGRVGAHADCAYVVVGAFSLWL